MNRIAGRLLLLVTVAYSSLIEANSDTDRIIQQEQQRIENERKIIERKQQLHSPIPFPRLEEQTGQEKGVCFDIEEIEFKGATIVSTEEKTKITATTIDQCVDLSVINELLRKITNWYIDKGYITTRAYIEPQDLSSGSLIITIIEGFIEDTRLKDAMSRLNVWTAFPGDKSELLNLRDIEQGLENLNRLQSIQSTIELLPGNQPGASIIEVSYQKKKPWQVSLSLDNGGQDSSGKNKQGFFFSIDNPLGLNDFSYINHQDADTPDSDSKDSKSSVWHWDMVMGYWQWGIDINYFNYLITQKSNSIDFLLSGSSLNQSIYLSHLLYRDKNSKLSWKADLSRKKNRNLIEDTVIPTSSFNLAIGGFEVNYERYLADNSSWQLGLRYERGLELFSARRDKESIFKQKAQFDKFLLDLDYQKIIYELPSWLPEETPLIYESSLHLQSSSDELYSSQQINIGSQYSVRGYHETSISGSSGAYWRNSLKLQWRPKVTQDWLKTVQPFMAIDVGAIRDRDEIYEAGTYATLSGFGVGATFANQYLTVDIAYTRPINPPRWLPLESQEQWHFKISVRY